MAININGKPTPSPEVANILGDSEEQAKAQVVTSDPKSKLAFLSAAVLKEKPGVLVTGDKVPQVERVPTGCFEFDLAVGGGFPKGRISIIYGVESSGKTNLLLKAIAYVQKYFPAHCNKCVFVDLEGTFDPKWAEKMGVDVDALIVAKPAYGEEAVDIVDALIRAEDLAFIAVDSVAVMVSTKEIEQSAEKFDVGTSSILVKRLCNKAVIALAQEAKKGHYPALVLINQRRFKIGVMFGDPETMPGGETMKFLSSLTIRLYGKNVADAKIHPDMPVWKQTEAVIKKSKVPITSQEFSYKMAMMPAGDLDTGETDSWNAVAGYLKSMGSLVKDKDGWRLFGKLMPTLIAWEEQYVCDLGFRVKCQQAVVQSVASAAYLVGQNSSAPKGDK